MKTKGFTIYETLHDYFFCLSMQKITAQHIHLLTKTKTTVIWINLLHYNLRAEFSFQPRQKNARQLERSFDVVEKKTYHELIINS